MHQPGYVQGGQEVGRGYLLLGIHYRRIREHYNIKFRTCSALAPIFFSLPL
jgi:hypothetical protein